MMTLEEAIEHCNEKACGKNECSAEHRQLSEWLKELKTYRENKKIQAVLNGAEILEDWQKEKIASWDTMLETKDEISKNYSKLLNNPKVQAVLKGADVIEMPSKSDIVTERDLRMKACDVYGEFEPAFQDGFYECYEYLKSKIVK